MWMSTFADEVSASALEHNAFKLCGAQVHTYLWCRRSTASPQSLSPHIHEDQVDDADRGRLSPSYQTRSLHQQQPLVPASERQLQQQTLMKVYQQPVNSFPATVHSVVQNNDGDVLLSRGSVQQQYVDGGLGSLSRQHQQQQQHPVIDSYQEQRIMTSETRQVPASLTTTSYSTPQSTTSSLSSQPSNTSATGGGGKQVRVLDASGRDIQVHSGFDGSGTDPPVRHETTTVQQSAVFSQSQPAATQQTAAAASTNSYSDLENIMAEFDVCSLAKFYKHFLNLFKFLMSHNL